MFIISAKPLHGRTAFAELVRGIFSIRRPSPRQLAEAITLARNGEMRRIHASQTDCLGCAIVANIQLSQAYSVIPRGLRTDDWLHTKIYMPATRAYTKLEQGNQ